MSLFPNGDVNKIDRIEWEMKQKKQKNYILVSKRPTQHKINYHKKKNIQNLFIANETKPNILL